MRRIGPKSAEERSKKNELFQIKDEATTSGWWLKRQYDIAQHDLAHQARRGKAQHSTVPRTGRSEACNAARLPVGLALNGSQWCMLVLLRVPAVWVPQAPSPRRPSVGDAVPCRAEQCRAH